MTAKHYGPGRPIVQTKRPGKLSPPPDKPCPVCYKPMRLVDGRWVCLRHGEPA